MTRIDRLRELLSEPLLITNLVNVRYLTGFDSSNAALLVEPDGGARLFTDFRYIEAARGIEGVETVMTTRSSRSPSPWSRCISPTWTSVRSGGASPSSATWSPRASSGTAPTATAWPSTT